MLRRFQRALLPFSLLIAAGACADSEGVVVARAGDMALSVDQLVELVAPNAEIPASGAALLEVADMWIDYTLLARAYAEDSTLAQLDLGPVVEERIDQEKVATFRRSHVQLDTEVSEEEIRAQYADEAVRNSQVRARHILLRFPENATEEQADSVRQLAASLRDRVTEGGEDFAALAREYSEDPESAGRGGDIGYILPGQVIDPIERMAYSLPPGEVSPVFPSSLGLHLLRVEDRRTPPLPEFRAWARELRVTSAEAEFVRRLVEEADTQRTENVLTQLRLLAASPRQPLDSVPEDHVLVAFGDGGALTVGDARRFFLGRPVPFLVTAATAAPEEVDALVLGTLLQSERLVAAAEDAGVDVSDARREEIGEEARVALVELVRRIGLAPASASERDVREAGREAVLRTLRGERDVVPLGPYAFALWRAFGGETVRSSLEQALAEVQALRRLGPRA